MGRKIGWEDQKIKGGRGGGPDKERRFRGVKGTTFIIRVLTECEEFRKHFVDDVLEPDEKTGEPRGFNMNCGKTWDDDEQDYTGDCLGCERDYNLSTSYIAGILVLGLYKGRSTRPQRMDPENAVHWWDFGPDKYRQISDIVLELQRAEKPKKLSQVELTVKCEDETYQKLNISISQAKPIMNKKNAKDYLECWKEEGPPMIEEATVAPSLEEQKRQLKPRKRKRRDDDEDDGYGEEDEKPRRRKKKAKKRKKRDEPEEEEEVEDSEEEEVEDSDDEEDLDDILDNL